MTDMRERTAQPGRSSAITFVVRLFLAVAFIYVGTVKLLPGEIGRQPAGGFGCDERYVAVEDENRPGEIVKNRKSGAYQLTTSEEGMMAVMNDLHKGRDAGRAWAWEYALWRMIPRRRRSWASTSTASSC